MPEYYSRGIFRISSLPARLAPAPRLHSLHRNATTHQEPQMITAFFAFVTVAFFSAVVANVAESVASARSFA